jgi:hypothetical protein
VGRRVAGQENDAFSEHPASFVLDRLPKLLQRFTHIIITVYTTQSAMNIGRAFVFCVKNNASQHVPYSWRERR